MFVLFGMLVVEGIELVVVGVISEVYFFVIVFIILLEDEVLGL